MRKIKPLTWEQLKEQDPKQTVAVVEKTWYHKPLVCQTQIYLKGWTSRQEAWEGCKHYDIINGTRYVKDIAVESRVRLLKLNKVIRELEATKPKDTAAAIILN